MRLRLSFVVLVTSALACVGLVSAPTANALAWPGANVLHPYSDPVWFPFRDQPIRIDCAGSSTNNNSAAHCSHDHVGYYAINFVVPKYTIPPTLANPHPKVYSAGAGIVSKIVSGQSCNHGTGILPGNVVYVQHGGGIVAVYEHLHAVSVSVGEYVTPETPIGTVGATGVPCANGVEAPGYLDFQVRHWGGSAALTKDIPTLLGCSDGKAVVWPAALPLNRYQYFPPTTQPKVWTQVPFGAGIIIGPSDFTCIPKNGGTGSPNEITTAHLTTSSPSLHTLNWTAVAGANAYTVEFEVKKGTTWSVPCSPFVTAGCTYGFYLFGATSTPHFTMSGTGAYRARVYAHNGIGYSKVSNWYYT